uniref:Uncharacterized protein n=1 Tax=Tetranychus urticae TaxID=32264 RepID=T1KC95_TETUR
MLNYNHSESLGALTLSIGSSKGFTEGYTKKAYEDTHINAHYLFNYLSLRPLMVTMEPNSR